MTGVRRGTVWCTGRRWTSSPGRSPGTSTTGRCRTSRSGAKETGTRGSDGGENGENEGRVEANEDDVAEGAKTLVFQVDDAPKGAKDGSELIRKGKAWSLK